MTRHEEREESDDRVLIVGEIELREITIPLRRPFRISSGTREETRKLLLELQHPDGISCWAECVAPETPNYTAETIDTAWLALREWLAPRVLGRRLGSARDKRESRYSSSSKTSFRIGYSRQSPWSKCHHSQS